MKIYTLSTISPRVKDFNPREFMNSFGINYIRYIITSMSETIIYEGCTNVPEHPYQLPDYITVIEIMDTQDTEVKSVEIVARPQNRAVLLTLNKNKEFINIEHGYYTEMLGKFDAIHKQLMKEKQ